MESIYSRIEPGLLKRLKLAAVHRGVNQPTAIAEAIEKWVESAEHPQQKEATKSEEFTQKLPPNSVQHGTRPEVPNGISTDPVVGVPGPPHISDDTSNESGIKSDAIQFDADFDRLQRIKASGHAMAIEAIRLQLFAFEELVCHGRSDPDTERRGYSTDLEREIKGLRERTDDALRNQGRPGMDGGKVKPGAGKTDARSGKVVPPARRKLS